MSFSKIPPSLLPGDSDIFLNTIIGIPERPPELTASENPISWILDTLTVGSNAPATITIDVTANPINGDLFRLVSVLSTFPTIELVGSDTPTFGEYNISFGPVAVASSIARVLNDDLIFCRLFYADSLTTPGTIIITAINPGRVYNLNFEGAAAFSVLTNTVGLDETFGQSAKDFSLYIDIFADGAGSYGDTIDKNTMRFIDRIQKNYQKDNIHPFDVGGLLRNLVKMPPPSTAAIANIPETSTNYALMFGFVAKDDTNINERVISGITAVNWVNNSALGLLNVNDLSDYIITPGATNKKPLSNLPACKDFYEGQKDYLNLIYKRTPGLSIIIIYMVPTFYDGTTGPEVIVTGAAGNGGQWSVKMDSLPFSSIEITNGKLIKSFTLDIRAVDTFPIVFPLPTIAQQKYIVRRDCPERTTDIVFLNQLGGYDGLRLTERLSQTQAREVSEFEKTPPFIPDGSETIRGVQRAGVICSERWASGWLPADHYNFLKGLQNSPQVYQSTPDGFRVVVVESANIEFDDEAEKYNLTMEFTPTDPQNQIGQ